MRNVLMLLILLIPLMGWGQDDLYGPKEPKREKRAAEIYTSVASDSLNRWVYCEIVGTQKLLSKEVVVDVDYGQESSSYWTWTENRIRDENGKVKRFNSMVDAMNYMGNNGWEFVQAYAITYGSSNVYHWLLKADKNNPVFIPKIKTRN